MEKKNCTGLRTFTLFPSKSSSLNFTLHYGKKILICPADLTKQLHGEIFIHYRLACHNTIKPRTTSRNYAASATGPDSNQQNTIQKIGAGKKFATSRATAARHERRNKHDILPLSISRVSRQTGFFLLKRLPRGRNACTAASTRCKGDAGSVYTE